MALVANDDGGLPFPTFAVEIGSLSDFIAFIERELGVSLDSGVDRVRLDSYRGQALAAGLAGGMISTSRQNHVDSLRFPISNMVRYLLTSVAMLEVIEQLMQLYKTTEELATLTTRDIQAFLTIAFEQKSADLRAITAANRPTDGAGTEG